MGRRRANTRIDGTRHVVPETIKNDAVHPNADILETKSQFVGYGHDHTGDDQGAIIDLTENLIFNGNFEHSIRNEDGTITPSGAPDFWEASGVMVGVYPSGYMGNTSCIINNAAGGSYPQGTQCLWQDVPSPSGNLYPPLPSGVGFAGRTLTFGCWHRYDPGVDPYTGLIYLGYNDGYGDDQWSSYYSCTNDWQWINWTFTLSESATRLRMLVYSMGIIYIDNVQLCIGTRLIGQQPLRAESDTDLWRRVNAVYRNGEDSTIGWAEVVVVDASRNLSVKYAEETGQGGVAGVTVAPSPSGHIVGVTNRGITDLKVHGDVQVMDLLVADADPDWPGFAIAERHEDDFINPKDGGKHTFATALVEKAGDTAGIVKVFVDASPALSDRWAEAEGNIPATDTKVLSAAPVYANTIEGTVDGDDSGALYKGWDGVHNFYRWSWLEADAERAFVLDASGNVNIIGEMSTTGVVLSGVALTSDEVYQEGILIGRVGKTWGDQIDRVLVKFASASGYRDQGIEDEVLAYDDDGTQIRPEGYEGLRHSIWPSGLWDPTASGAIYPSGWDEVGFDLRDGTLELIEPNVWRVRIDGERPPPVITIDAPGYPGLTGYLRWDDAGQSGDYIYDHPVDGWQVWASGITPSGITLTSISGYFRKEGTTSPYNSLVTRIMVPHDFVRWVSGYSYVWNKVEWTSGWYGGSGILPENWFIGSDLVPAVVEASGATLASLSYYIYDTSGVLVASGIDLMNATRHVVSGWDQTEIYISGGTWEPNEWFTMRHTLRSDYDTYAYLGELALYYRNY